MKIAEVWIEHPVVKLDQVYCYDAHDLPVLPGKRVLVNFNHRQIVGFVDQVRIVEETPAQWKEKNGYALKSIEEVIDDHSLVTPELFSLAKWMAEDTLSPVISCFQAILPAKIKPRSTQQTIKMEQVASFVQLIVGLTPKQTQLLMWLKQHDQVELKLWREQSASVTRLLEKRGCVKLISRQVREKAQPVFMLQDFLALNQHQQEVMDQILSTDKQVTLLHGVTGSGKTEVYLHLARQIIQQGKQVLILVPEISLTPQMVSRVKGRFGSHVAIYHSGLNDQEKYEQYCKVFEKKAQIVVGTRSAVFMPFLDLGLIVMDEEHDTSYKQDSLPQYHCKDVALHRAMSFRCKVVLGSATPSLESYARALKGVYQLAEMKDRVNQSVPRCFVVDMKNEKQSRSSILSEPLMQAIQNRLDIHQQCILLLNRRGYSPILKCDECGTVVQCPHCEIALSYHKFNHRLKCHLCGSEYPVVSSCPSCHHKTLLSTGYGTQKLQEEVQRFFPTARILRMDADTTTRKDSHHQLLDAFGKKQADILVGTQMIAKGLDFPDVTLVGILNADAAVARTDFRSVEMTFDLIMQASGRSGRAQTVGDVFIQAFDANHYAVVFGSQQDYQGFFYQEMKYRHLGGYPPYTYLIALTFSDKVPDRPKQAALWMKDCLQKEQLRILGPSDLIKIKDLYRSRLVLKGKDLEGMKKALSLCLSDYKKRKDQTKLTIDVNPLILE